MRVLRESAVAPLLPAMTMLLERYSGLIGSSSDVNGSVSSTAIAMLTLTKTVEQLSAEVSLYLGQLKAGASSALLFGEAVLAGGLVTKKGRGLLGEAVDALTDPWASFQSRLNDIDRDYDAMIDRLVESSRQGAAQIEQVVPTFLPAVSVRSGGSSRAAGGSPVPAPLLPEMAGDYDSEADALEWIAGIEADQHAARVAREMERLDLIEQRRVAELSAAEAVTQAHKDAIDKQIGYTEYFVQASATLWDAVAQAVVKSTRDGSKARREALMAQFVMERVSANAQLTIDGVKAISSAASSAPYPANLVAIGLAVATAVANRIALNAVPAPNLVADAGFTSDDLRRAGFTGRQTVMMHDGETVLGPQASSDASRIADAMAQVRSRVEGSSMGGDPVFLVSVGGEQVEAVVTRMQADSIRRGDHTLPLALRDARL